MRFPISARALHRRRVVLRDAALDDASLFPFFDDLGRVEATVLVWPGSAQILVLDPRPGLARCPLWRPIELDAAYADLRDLAPSDDERLRDLDHFDPWWVLAEPRFALHRAIPALKATNCVDRLRPSMHCAFTRDLARLFVVPSRLFKPRPSQRTLCAASPCRGARRGLVWRLAPDRLARRYQ